MPAVEFPPQTPQCHREARGALRRIAMFVPTLESGGAEHILLTLADGFLKQGYAVDLVVVRAAGGLLPSVPRGVRLIELGTRHVISSVPALVRYLRREQPSALLSTLNRANAVAVLATRLARLQTRVVIRQASNPQYSGSFKYVSVATAMLDRAIIRCVYPLADGVIAVSRGVADDLSLRMRVRRTTIDVVPNPVVTSELLNLAGLPLDHEWFADGAPPVILGTGRLTPVKQFDVLIRAFAVVRQSHDARLIILGEGDERPRLESLVRELELERVVSLPGFVQNPFVFMARSRVFVLSSAFEGLPGALIQALACGTNVVATDCHSGPHEILHGGRFGRLVPVANVPALADAISSALCAPRIGGAATEAWLPYTDSVGIDAYLRVLERSANG
jgi:glycosyltransferase involved in cell wall biosynthesis